VGEARTIQVWGGALPRFWGSSTPPQAPQLVFRPTTQSQVLGEFYSSPSPPTCLPANHSVQMLGDCRAPHRLCVLACRRVRPPRPPGGRLRRGAIVGPFDELRFRGGRGSGEPDAASGEHDATSGSDASADHEAPVDTGSGRDTEPAQLDSGGDDAMASDTSAGGCGARPGIACGSGMYCAPSSQTCCVSSGGLGGTQRRCANGNSCGSGTPVHCDDTADCPSGQVCCGLDYVNVATRTSRAE